MIFMPFHSCLRKTFNRSCFKASTNYSGSRIILNSELALSWAAQPGAGYVLGLVRLSMCNQQDILSKTILWIFAKFIADAGDNVKILKHLPNDRHCRNEGQW